MLSLRAYMYNVLVNVKCGISDFSSSASPYFHIHCAYRNTGSVCLNKVMLVSASSFWPRPRGTLASALRLCPRPRNSLFYNQCRWSSLLC